jgi:hypothetical protein
MKNKINYFGIGILVILILGIVFFNMFTFKPLVEGHRGGLGRGAGFGRGRFGIGRGIGYGALGYGAYRGFYGGGDTYYDYYNDNDDYGYTYDYPPVYSEVTYDMYDDSILLQPS